MSRDVVATGELQVGQLLRYEQLPERTVFALYPDVLLSNSERRSMRFVRVGDGSKFAIVTLNGFTNKWTRDADPNRTTDTKRLVMVIEYDADITIKPKQGH